MLDRIFGAATVVIQRILALAFIVAVCLNFFNVLGRYFFGRVMLSADELQSFILLFMTIMGAAVVTWEKSHIAMSIILDSLPSRIAGIVDCTAQLTLVIARQSWHVAKQMFIMERVSDAAGVPMWIIHGLVFLSFVLIAAFALYQGVSVARLAIASRGEEESTSR
jgi:C4-dicarboxylate transporter DctQ subunit